MTEPMNYIIDSVIFSLGETNSHKYSVVEIDIDCVQLRADWCGRRDLNPHTTEVTEPKSVESANSTTPAYSFVPLILTRGGCPRWSVTLNPHL